MDAASLIASVDSNAKRTPSKSFLIKLFKELRKSKTRRSDLVVKYGPDLLSSLSGSELWTVVEQVFLASLDVGEKDTADGCLKILTRKFPSSARVSRLQGMLAEFEGDYAKALSIYNEILQEQPANMLLMKRKVAVHRSMGASKEAIEELLNIVKHFPFDIASWLELATIYLDAADLETAAHCYEEVILLEPTNAHYHTRLGEVYYSIGDYDYLVLARKQFSSSLTMLAPDVNLRALHGLLYACKALQADTSATSKTKKEMVGPSGVTDEAVSNELFAWAKEKLEAMSVANADGKELHSRAFVDESS